MEAIYVKGAPDAIGPYCHAMKVGNLVFVSGQAAVNPATKKLEGSGIEEQTEQTFNNISAILAGMDLNLKNIVKTTVFFERHGRFSRDEQSIREAL